MVLIFLIQVTWFRNTVKLFETDQVLMTLKSNTWSLKLTQLKADMFGNYTCVASNRLGTQQRSTQVSGKWATLQAPVEIKTTECLNH